MADELRPLLVTERQVRTLETVIKRVLSIRGRGVSNGPAGITINPPMPAQRPAIMPDTGDWYVITGATRDGANFRWTYDVKVALPPTGSAVAWDQIGEESEAINTIEIMNGASGLMGNGVDTADLAGTALELQRAPDGAIVRCFNSGRWLAFEYVNSISGACEEE